MQVRAGLAQEWVNQNHDGLAQKAGCPQEKLNEVLELFFFAICKLEWCPHRSMALGLTLPTLLCDTLAHWETTYISGSRCSSYLWPGIYTSRSGLNINTSWYQQVRSKVSLCTFACASTANLILVIGTSLSQNYIQIYIVIYSYVSIVWIICKGLRKDCRTGQSQKKLCIDIMYNFMNYVRIILYMQRPVQGLQIWCWWLEPVSVVWQVIVFQR